MATNHAAMTGQEKEELMKRAIIGLAAAAIALASLYIPPAQAHADDASDDPCVSITDPVAHQACVDQFRDIYERRACEASPNHGQVGQVCG